MARIVELMRRLYLSALTIGGMAWALGLPTLLGYNIVSAEWLGPYLGVCIAAALLAYPAAADPERKQRWRTALDLVMGIVALCCWLWMGLHFEAWMFDFAGVTSAKFVPGLLAIAITLVALLRVCGAGITILTALMIAYGLFGYLLPGALSADKVNFQTLTMYLYADSQGVPGMVLAIVASLVFAFIVFGKMMELSGATGFFTDFSMALMGHRRAGPAKVSIVASGLFGSVSGSPVSNIMSTGVVTIPLMIRIGFRPSQAAAIEAAASTGGQLAPPVMGAAAFLMAEFLQIDYAEIAIAAALPALLFYVMLLIHVDAIAHTQKLTGVDRASLPRLGDVLWAGYVFIVPLGILLFLLFGTNMPAARAALLSALALFVLAVIKGQFRNRAAYRDFILGVGYAMISIVLIAAAAGIVVGVMNISGLGQSITTLLRGAAANWGMFAMLSLTALLAIILGLGMPVTAIYIVLASVLGPSLVASGVDLIGAHLFFFYFGVLSFLTPPVCVASFVAASLAKADMWETGWVALRFVLLTFLLPFLWVYNPALLTHGSILEILIVLVSILAANFIYLEAYNDHGFGPRGEKLISLAFMALAGAVAFSTVWFGSDQLLIVPGVIGLVALIRLLRQRQSMLRQPT